MATLPTLYDTHIQYYQQKFNTFYNQTQLNQSSSQTTDLTYITACTELLHHFYDLTKINTQPPMIPTIPTTELNQIGALALAGITLQDVTVGEYEGVPLSWLTEIFKN